MQENGEKSNPGRTELWQNQSLKRDMDTNINSSPEKSTFVEQEPPVQLKSRTILTYRTIYERCMRNSVQRRQATPDDPVTVTPMDLVEDWLATSGTKKPRYANTERSALIWSLNTLRETGWEEAYTRLRTVAQERNTVSRNKQAETDKRSREPGRMIPENDLRTLLNALTNMGQSGAKAQWWLVAGVASGARPIEWPDAEWIDEEKTVLRIYTAKVKARNAWHKVPPLTFTAEDLDNEVEQLWGARNARGSEMTPTWHEVDFERRISTIDLTEAERAELRANQFKNGVLLFRDVLIEPEYRRFVRLHMESVRSVMDEEKAKAAAAGEEPKSDEKIFSDAYFHPLRHTIWRACKKVFPDQLYSLVDTRSTFSANRKAAMGGASAQHDLGHASYSTSRDHYAPASRAWTRYKNAQKPGSAAAPENTDGVLPGQGASTPAQPVTHVE